MSALLELLRWCRENVPDGHISLCRVENISPCKHVCSECAVVEQRAKKLERELLQKGRGQGGRTHWPRRLW